MSDQLLTYDILDFQEDVCTFNDLSEQASKCAHKDLLDQYELIAEEATELLEGLEADDPVAVLDGVIDLLYVTLGLLQKLQNLGVNTEAAMQRVATDNLSKFPSDEKVLLESALLHLTATFNYNADNGVWVIKDSNNKVLKPSGFISTNLSEFIPQSLKDGFYYAS